MLNITFTGLTRTVVMNRYGFCRLLLRCRFLGGCCLRHSLTRQSLKGFSINRTADGQAFVSLKAFNGTTGVITENTVHAYFIAPFHEILLY